MKFLKTLFKFVVAVYIAITSFMTLYGVLFTVGMNRHYKTNGKDTTEMFNDAETGIWNLNDDNKNEKN